MVLIRADGNPQIGTGHIMRCLSLADALWEQGGEITFVTAEPYFQRLIQTRGYPCTVLGTAYDRMEEELSVFLPLLEREQPELVILDSYFVTLEYMKAIKGISKLLYIDDLNAFDYPADAVVNYAVYGPEMPYPQNKKYFLGPQYAPLRRQFQGLGQRIVRDHVEDVLISTGGTDQYHVALRCAKHLREHPPRENMKFHFVLGAMNQDVAELEGIAENSPSIQLHCQVADMCSLMCQCDAAVSAAGTTLYELCACGLPTVTYILADNQIQGAGAFQKAGLMPCAGDIRKNARFLEHLFELLNSLADDFAQRQRVAEQMQGTVDGRGAARLAEAVLKQSGSTENIDVHLEAGNG